MPERVSKTETKKITITLKKHKCENCSKVSGSYYEAVIQTRGRNAAKILKRIDESSKDILKIKKVENGYDIFYMNKKAAKKTASNLKKTFSIKESFKFITTKDGKRLYRNYYSLR